MYVYRKYDKNVENLNQFQRLIKYLVSFYLGKINVLLIYSMRDSSSGDSDIGRGLAIGIRSHLHSGHFKLHRKTAGTIGR